MAIKIDMALDLAAMQQQQIAVMRNPVLVPAMLHVVLQRRFADAIGNGLRDVGERAQVNLFIESDRNQVRQLIQIAPRLRVAVGGGQSNASVSH